MKITIIIPVHNEEKYIMRCVNSFLEQKYEKLELILIDDHSEDNSVSLCKKLEQSYANILFFQSEQRGVSAARNVGLEHATGEIIGFCDGDDTTVSGSLQMVRDTFQKYKDVDIVVTGYSYVKSENENKQVISHTYKKEKQWTETKLANHTMYDGCILGSVWNKFFKRNILNNHKFDSSLTHCEDTHFVMRILTSGKCRKIRILNKSLYYYYSNNSSATNSFERMFGVDGKLQYVLAMNKILEQCILKPFTYCLVRRAMFTLASDVFLRYRNCLSENQKVEIQKYLRENIGYFFVCFFIKPKENFFRFGALLKRKAFR